MSPLRDSLAIAAAAALAAGCGGGGSAAALSASSIPLVPGAQIVERSQQCDRGANAFCAVELVVVDQRFSSLGAFVTRQHEVLRHAGWSDQSGDFGDEGGADSPGHKLHVTYGTALADLTGVDEKWTQRTRPIAYALSRELFARVPTLSVMLERGPA